MQTPKKFLVLALVAILGTASAVAQTALSFSGDRAVIASGGRHYIPQSAWNTNQTLYIDIVNSLEPELGFENWTGQNSWGPQPGSQWSGNVDAKRQQYIKIDVPGLWTNAYSGVPEEKKLYIRRITDPTLTIGATSKPLSQWSFPQNVPRGTNVTLNINSFFVSGGGNNALFKDGSLLGGMQAIYSLTETANYELRVGDGVSPVYSMSFQISFIETQYALTASAGEGGTISPSGAVTVNAGANQTFTATPNSGKMVNQWKVNGNVVATSGNTYTVNNVQSNATVQVTFKDIPPVQYTLTASAGAGGTISPSGAVIVNAGANQTFTATPNSGKMVDQWKVNGNVVATSGNTYTVNNVQSNATVQVTFKDIPPVTYTVSFDADGGSPTPANQIVNAGEKATEPTVPTKAGFTFEGWYNGATKWNFSTDVVTANITLKAKWETEAPLPIFDGLEGEYAQGSAAIPLKLKGKDAEKFTVFKVNGETKSEFIPATKGSFLIEAATADGKSRIETYITVK
jgi:uncharacterized repeat protein (TIGR02543 family)